MNLLLLHLQMPLLRFLPTPTKPEVGLNNNTQVATVSSGVSVAQTGLIVESVSNELSQSTMQESTNTIAESLACLQNPQTFTLGSTSNSSSPKCGKKITKHSFLTGTSTIKDPANKTPGDPLDNLNPLWSIGDKTT